MSVTITPKLQQLINHLKSEIPDVLDITLEPVPPEWLKDVDCTEPYLKKKPLSVVFVR